MPLIYRFLKFLLTKKNIVVDFPLNNLFNENNYSPKDLLYFLNSFQFNSKAILPFFNQMKDWSGQYSKIDIKKIPNQKFNNFIHFYKSFFENQFENNNNFWI